MNPYDFFTTHSITNSKHYKLLKEDIANNRILAEKELILDLVPAEEVNLPYGSYLTSDDLVNWESRS